MIQHISMLRFQIKLLLVTLMVHGGRCDLGLMSTKLESQDDWKDTFCIAYNPQFHPIAKDRSTSLERKVVDLSNIFGCDDSDYHYHDVTDAIVIVARYICTFSEKALVAEKAGAKAVIVGSDDLILPGANQTSDYDKINISVSTMLWSDVRQLQNAGAGHVQVGILYEIVMGKFDANLVVIFLIAVTNIIVGGYWSGIARQEKYELSLQKALSKRENTQNNAGADEEKKSKVKNDDDSVNLSFCALAVGFVLVCGFLLLMYFFYSYLVYVVIAMFCIAGSMGLYYCLKPIVHRLCAWEGKLPENRIPVFKACPMYKDLILLALCFGLAIFWGVLRHAQYAWAIQDILGYAFCINVMRTVSIPNMKICTIMLIMLFIYDIFFVFISPLFTKNGKSIMVEVATGGSGGNSYSGKAPEMLPMVFTIPKLSISAIGNCQLAMSLLGFGDVIIPGLLVCHNHAFDLRVNSRRIYYIATCVGYALGLIITFVALAFMEKGQPALLYLVPCTLIPTFAIGIYRKEVKLLWSGVPTESKQVESAQAASTPELTVNSNDSGSCDSSIENETTVLISK